MAFLFDPEHSLVSPEEVYVIGDRVEWHCRECPSDRPTWWKAHMPDGVPWAPGGLERACQSLACLGHQHLLERHLDIPRVKREAQRQAREKRIADWWAKWNLFRGKVTVR